MSGGGGSRKRVVLLLLCLMTTTSRRNNYGIALALNALENEEEAVVTNSDEAIMLLFDGNEPVTGGGGAVFDETDWIEYDDTTSELLVDPVLLDENSNSSEEEKEEDLRTLQKQQRTMTTDKKSWKRTEEKQYDQQSSYYSDNVSSDVDDVMATAVQQFKRTSNRLVQKYYTPLPKQGKGALGGVIGYTVSRLALGVANRIFRIAGATYVLSEALYASGFCDEEKCSVIPEEARPWITILRRLLIRQCIKVRHVTRELWDTEKIRHVAQQDEVLSGGFAVGAFIGFVV